MFEKSYDFLYSFKPFYELLHPHIDFMPLYRFKNKLEAFSKGNKEAQDVTTHCYSQGEFCVSDHEISNGRPLDAIDEGIRQACIFKNDPSEVKRNWFDYSLSFKKKCLGQESLAFRTEKCSEDILKQ